MTRISVLGCGLVGATIVRDLAGTPGYDVTAVDITEGNLAGLPSQPNVTKRRADATNPRELHSLIQQSDVLVGALPSNMGFSVLRYVIDDAKPYVDISFMPEDPLDLDQLARSRDTTAIVDCGVAPGLANMIVGYCDSILDTVERVEYYVGGLPISRSWPYEYKAPFSPVDVIEEYTRPARQMDGGKLVIKEALSEPELIDFPPIGTLEAFNTDGLRTLLRTVRAAYMREKTLRYPGHRQLMQVLRHTGYFNRSNVEVGGLMVSPLEVTSKLLFPLWQLEPGERNFTALRVTVVGESGTQRLKFTYELYHESDPGTTINSMAHATAHPCCSVVRMVADGTLPAKGVIPPEKIGAIPGLLSRVREELAQRGVFVHDRVEELTPQK